MLDTTKFGYVAIRESLSMRIGWSGTDFAENILRTVAEEQLLLCVTRPPAGQPGPRQLHVIPEPPPSARPHRGV